MRAWQLGAKSSRLWMMSMSRARLGTRGLELRAAPAIDARRAQMFGAEQFEDEADEGFRFIPQRAERSHAKRRRIGLVVSCLCRARVHGAEYRRGLFGRAFACPFPSARALIARGMRRRETRGFCGSSGPYFSRSASTYRPCASCSRHGRAGGWRDHPPRPSRADGCDRRSAASFSRRLRAEHRTGFAASARRRWRSDRTERPRGWRRGTLR